MRTCIGYRNRSFIVKYMLLLAIFFTGTAILSRGSQNIDPFYLRLLQRGEESFTAGKYLKAAEELEIAAFGLTADRKLKGKALVYLSLSHLHLQQIEDGDKHLRNALELIDESEIADLELDASSHGILEEGLSRIRPSEPDRAASPDTAGGQPTDESEAQPEDDIRELEKRLQRDRDNPVRYYELTEAYLHRENKKAARKTLRNLIKRKPEEINAYFQLGIMDYQSRRYKEAARAFNDFFRRQGSTSLPENTLELARVYQILSTHLGGSRKKALKILTGSLTLLTEESLRDLPLAPRDRSLITQIMIKNQDVLNSKEPAPEKEQP